METTIMNAEPLSAGQAQQLELFFRGKAVQVVPDQTPYTIGRDTQANALCIESDYASRQHCSIEFRQGQYVLRDHSKNGTYLQLGRAHGFKLHNESVPLSAGGCFKLGEHLDLGDPDLVHFKVKV